VSEPTQAVFSGPRGRTPRTCRFPRGRSPAAASSPASPVAVGLTVRVTGPRRAAPSRAGSSSSSRSGRPRLAAVERESVERAAGLAEQRVTAAAGANVVVAVRLVAAAHGVVIADVSVVIAAAVHPELNHFGQLELQRVAPPRRTSPCAGRTSSRARCTPSRRRRRCRRGARARCRAPPQRTFEINT
jgi:hypothetical protein